MIHTPVVFQREMERGGVGGWVTHVDHMYKINQNQSFYDEAMLKQEAHGESSQVPHVA